ncbi:MAG: PrsW family intramembrane metalloprotease [Bacilli bacterium]|nr:PrsW family intramembrane metalloprotease [Bacilli bacterium]
MNLLYDFSNLLQRVDPSKLIIVLLLTILPSILLFSLILYSDRKSKEPILLILICIFSGAFTICFSLIIDKLLLKYNLVIGNQIASIQGYNLFRIFIFASVEEICKLLVLILFLYRNKNYDDIFDGFVYASIIALSFSLVETILYVLKEKTFSDMSSLALLRNFTSIPLHVVCGIVMGYFISLCKFAKIKRKKIKNIILAIITPIFIHTIYNLFFELSYVASTTDENGKSIIVIILFVLSIYFVGIMFILKTNLLNKIYVANGVYPKRKNYLMTKNEFIIRESKKYTY